MAACLSNGTGAAASAVVGIPESTELGFVEGPGPYVVLSSNERAKDRYAVKLAKQIQQLPSSPRV